MWHSFCAATSKVLYAQCHSSLSAEGIFPGNLLGFGTNPVRQVEAMDHWHLAPPDSQHNVSIPLRAEELTTVVACYPLAPGTAGGPSLITSHASRFPMSI